MIRSYHMLPRIPDAGLLERYLDTLGVIVPLARTNMIANPSVETNITGYSAATGGETLARTTAQQARGAYSLSVAPGAGLNNGVQRTITTVVSSVYAASLDVLGASGVPYQFRMVDGGGTTLARYNFTGTGKWQRLSIVGTAIGISTLMQLLKDNSASTATFYTDGWQFELCNDGYNVATTYIDGDQRGLVPNQYPPAYGWNGTPHASTSYRIGQTRAGGRVVLLKNLGFLLTAIIGLGLAPPQHQALTFAQLDGGQYQNTLKPPRQFSLTGRVVGSTPNEADTAVAQLGDLLDRDLIAQRQPLVLTMQAQACGNDCGERVFVPALYSGGLEGNVVELPSQQVPITFTQYLPFVLGGDQGTALTVQQSVSNANAIAQRSPAGVWSAVGTGVSGGTTQVRAIARGLNGLIYVGGNFTDAGGSGADYLASYNPQTGVWAALGSTTAINGEVDALAIGPDGKLYVGGLFTNAGGNANADSIAVWDPTAGTWAALSTGTAGQIFALAFSPSGILYAGGSFGSIGGSTADNIAQWNGTAWSNLASDTAINATVEALAWGNGRLYVGGAFTNANGNANADYIATWDGSAWAALSTGMNSDVLAIVIGANGLVYAGGAFTTAGGMTATRVAAWNGQQWAPMGEGLNSTVRAMSRALDGAIYASGAFTATGSLTLPDALARWNGTVWLPADIDLPSTVNVYTVQAFADGSIFVGFDATGTAVAAGLLTVTNSGNVDIWPTLTIYGPTSGTSRIYQLVNTTTGAAIYFNYTINAGEVATLTLDPTNVTFTSTFQGNILSTILPGSQQALFSLQPGANVISFFAADASVTAVIQSQIAYTNLNKALYQAVTP